MGDAGADASGATEAADRSTLARRRATYAGLVAFSIAGLIALAAAAVPPRSIAACCFLALFSVTLPWTVVGFWNAAIGFWVMRRHENPAAAVNPLIATIRGDEPLAMSTAILMCIRNESPALVVRNLRPMLAGLARAGVARRFHLYLLSDSSDPGIVAAEAATFAAFAADWAGTVDVAYRRRDVNTGFKSGNIREFCERWGADHQLAITLDADSFMPAPTVMRLVRIMQANPRLGILQTLVIGLPSTSLFARVFQFGMRLGMHAYTLGGAWWQGDCGPYWGHNAILRLAPFIADCGMPILPGGGPLSGHVLSHDQVEAALMRRGGHEVRVLVEEGSSWEENPPNLLEFMRRELRWCHGNMQYWRLIGLPGLQPVSRVQLLFAILMYLGSPAWIAMLAIGAIALAVSGAPGSPLRSGAGEALFAIIMAMNFAPKIASLLDALMNTSSRRAHGGAGPLVANALGETLFMILLSPIMALSHTLFLIRLFVFRRGGAWNAHAREDHATPWTAALARLWPQTLVGSMLLIVVAARAPGALALALLGAGGLVLAAPFAVATSSPWLGRLATRIGIGRIPEETRRPEALRSLNLPALGLIPTPNPDFFPRPLNLRDLDARE
jgi:membrane glycosyltransferase